MEGRHQQIEEGGNILLELSLVLPFLLMVTSFTIDYFQTFRSIQYMVVVAREVGNAVSRRCTEVHFDGDPAGTTLMSSCVALQVSGATAALTGTGGVLNGMTAIVKVYKVNPGSAPTQVGGYNSGGTSRYNDTAIQNLNCYTAEKGLIFTTEIFLARPMISRFFSTQFYETSIF